VKPIAKELGLMLAITRGQLRDNALKADEHRAMERDIGVANRRLQARVDMLEAAIDLLASRDRDIGELAVKLHAVQINLANTTAERNYARDQLSVLRRRMAKRKKRTK